MGVSHDRCDICEKSDHEDNVESCYSCGHSVCAWCDLAKGVVMKSNEHDGITECLWCTSDVARRIIDDGQRLEALLKMHNVTRAQVDEHIRAQIRGGAHTKAAGD